MIAQITTTATANPKVSGHPHWREVYCAAWEKNSESICRPPCLTGTIATLGLVPNARARPPASFNPERCGSQTGQRQRQMVCGLGGEHQDLWGGRDGAVRIPVSLLDAAPIEIILNGKIAALDASG